MTCLMFLFLTFLGSLCLAQTNQPHIKENFKPANTNQPGKYFPQINSEGRGRSSISVPEAKKVQLDVGG
jgi:hypothetical protein